MVSSLLSYTNPVFAGYAFYAAIVLIKMFALSFATSHKRGQKQVFANPEDAATFGSKRLDPKVHFSDPDVERVRRNHLNDLENIPAFLFLGLLYILVEPSTAVALWHFRIFVGSRFLHTLAYQLPLPQPSRALFYFAGTIVCFSMAAQIILRAY
jgi:glutathione S-transferase